MKPITAPEVINKGIAVFVPTVEASRYTTLKIFYSRENPLYSWRDCEPESFILWEKTESSTNTGILFLYRVTRDLEVGFYKLEVSNYLGNSASQNIGLIEPTSRIIIGLPFSIYSPIVI